MFLGCASVLSESVRGDSMPLDPQAQAFLDQFAALGGQPLSSMPVPIARQSMEMLAAMRGAEVPLASAVGSHASPGRPGEIPVRVYTPNGTAPFPLLVYFHGGGWVLGSLEHARRHLPRAGANGPAASWCRSTTAWRPSTLSGGGRRLLRGDAVGVPRTPRSSAPTRRASPSAATAPAATSPPSWRRWRATAAARRSCSSC